MVIRQLCHNEIMLFLSILLGIIKSSTISFEKFEVCLKFHFTKIDISNESNDISRELPMKGIAIHAKVMWICGRSANQVQKELDVNRCRVTMQVSVVRRKPQKKKRIGKTYRQCNEEKCSDRTLIVQAKPMQSLPNSARLPFCWLDRCSRCDLKLSLCLPSSR